MCRFYKTQKHRMDRSDQYPDLAECKHRFVRRRLLCNIREGGSRGSSPVLRVSGPTLQRDVCIFHPVEINVSEPL